MKKRLVLITFFQADYNLGGGAILREQFNSLLDSYQIHWFYHRTQPENSSLLKEITDKNISLHPLRSRLKVMFSIDFRSLLLAIKARVKIKKNDMVWIVLDYKSINLAYCLAKSISNRIHISVHDDCRFSGVRRMEIEGHDLKCKYLFSRASSVEVIGENLADEYEKKFGVKSFVYRNGIDLDKVEFRYPEIKRKYNLIFLGSSHSLECWRQFFTTLADFENTSFEIDVYSNTDHIIELHDLAPNNIAIECCGIVAETELMKKCQRYDFGVFFWEDMPKNRLEFSVSTKVTTYLKLGLPILAIISPIAELYKMFERNVAINIKDTDENKFFAWLEQEDLEACFIDFIDAQFNKRVMLARLEDAFEISNKTSQTPL